MDVQWRPADLDLRPFIVGFVERTDSRAPGAAVEFPLAFPLLQVLLGADYSLEMDGRMRKMPRAALVGNSSATRRAVPHGKLRAFVTVLTFKGASLLIDGPPATIAGRVVDFDAIPSLASIRLWEKLAEADGLSGRAELVQQLVRSLLVHKPGRADGDYVVELAGRIAGHSIKGSVAALAHRTGLHERTLYNHFRTEIGCGPKQLLRLARLHRVIRALHPSPWGGKPFDDPLLEYFDEAHLHRDFMALTGLSPSEFTATKRRTGDHLVHSFLSAPIRHGRCGVRIRRGD